MPIPIFQDIAAVQKILIPGINPIGEAPKEGEVCPKLSKLERQIIMDRILILLFQFITSTLKLHCQNRLHQDFITRLSTDEFFFT